MRTLLFLAVVLLSAPVLGQQVEKTKDYKVSYPVGWELKPNYLGTETMALSQLEASNDTFRENCNTVSEALPIKTMDASGYHQASLPAMKSQLKKFKSLATQSLTTATGIDAFVMDYRHTYGELDIFVRATFYANAGTGYVVTCSATTDGFNRFEKIFDYVAQSFTFVSKTTKTKKTPKFKQTPKKYELKK